MKKWKSYRKKWLHNSKDFSLEQIQKHLQIEKELKDREKCEVVRYSKANAVTAKVKKKHDGKKTCLWLKKEQNKLKNSRGSKGPKGGCYMGGKIGHHARDCRNKKSKNEKNVVQAYDNITTIVRKIMAIKCKVQGWMYDTYAIVRVYYDKTTSKIYSEVNDG